MSSGKHVPIEEMEFFKQYVEVADWAWNAVMSWVDLPRDTVGKQLVRAADSVGANLVEGDGRSTDPDAIRFFVIARASARETRFWLNRSRVRGLLKPEEADEQLERLISATRQLNALIRYRRRAKSADRVSDQGACYESGSEDPFDEAL